MLTRLAALVRGLLRRRAIEAEVEEELAFHLQQETQAHLDRGVSAAEARRLALISLGGVTQTQDAVRDIRTTSIEAVWRETRHGFRALLAAPAFTIPAIVVLGLGIGGTTAVFSVVDGVLLRSLPFPRPDEIVRVWSRNDERQIAFLSVSPADFEDWQQRASAMQQFAAYERPRSVSLRETGGDPVNVCEVSQGLFPLLGASPVIGRTFTDGDHAAAVLSHGLWQRHFHGSPTVIGRSLLVGQQPRTVVGVMPASFQVPNAVADLWIPLDRQRMAGAPFAHTLRVLARVGPGVDVIEARRDLERVAAQIATERPAESGGWSITMTPLFDTVVSPEFRRSLWIVAGAVLFVLMMASTSVAGLLLARSMGRQRELAVRVALGASRGSLVRLLLLECLALAAIAGAVGFLVSFLGTALLQRLGSSSVPRLDEVALSGRVFGFAAFVTLASAIGAGLLPAWRSTSSLHQALRTRDSLGVSSPARALHFLVVLEVTAAVLLVVGAALLVQTVRNLHQRDLGFDASRLLSVSLAWHGAEEGKPLVRETNDIIKRLSTLPGVSAVSASSAPPFSGQNSGNTFEVEGRPSIGPPADTDYRVVSPGYLDALGIPLRLGRGFTETDNASPGAIVVSETAARRFWPDGRALNSRLRLGRSDWLTVVGIVGDVRHGALDDPDDSVRPMMYVPHGVMPATPMTILLRTSLDPAALMDTVRQTLAGDGRVGVGRLNTMAGMVREASVAQRFTMSLVSSFAATALTLAIVGLYGLLAFTIGRRTKEIGVRMALGAGRGDVLRLIMGRTLALAAAGILSGLLASLAFSGALRSALFGISENDPLTYGAVALGFLLLAAVAATLPARRALRIDPVRALSSE